MLSKEVRVDGRLIGTIVDGAGMMLESLKVLQEVGAERAAKAIADTMESFELDVALVSGAKAGLLRLIEADLRCPPVKMCEMASVEFDLDPRPLVARVDAPQYLAPHLLRMDASSRKYQSTQKNWRRYDGNHFKKNKRIK